MQKQEELSKHPCGKAAWLVVQVKRHAAIASVNQREQTELAKEHAALEDRQTAAAAETADARAGMAQARVLRKEEEEYEVCWSVAHSAATLLPTRLCPPPDVGCLTTRLFSTLAEVAGGPDEAARARYHAR